MKHEPNNNASQLEENYFMITYFSLECFMLSKLITKHTIYSPIKMGRIPP